MIEVDISGVWGDLSLTDLLEMEQEVSSAHMALTEGTCPGAGKRGWTALPLRNPTEEIKRILRCAELIRTDSDVCVVLAVGAGMGVRAVTELLQGQNRNLGRGKGDPMLLFAGETFSTRGWNELMDLLEERDFSLIVAAGTELPLETAIAFRALKWKLERKYGSDEAAGRIYAVTDPEKGPLREMAEIGGWESFCWPEEISEGYSLLTAAGLLPLAVAGIDIMEILNGAMDARERYDIRSLENPVWLYAALRNILWRKGLKTELLETLEPGFRSFGRWWQQMLGACGKGPMTTGLELTTDTHFLGRLLAGGEQSAFQTFLRFDPPARQHIIGLDWRDLDRLNDLEGKPLELVEEMAWQSLQSVFQDAGVPVIAMNCGRLKERTLGELIWFVELGAALSAILCGADPFVRPGEPRSSRNLQHLLGRSGGEE